MKIFKINLIIVTLSFLALNLYSNVQNRDPGVFTSKDWKKVQEAPTYLGNGYMGVRVDPKGVGLQNCKKVPGSTILTGVWSYVKDYAGKTPEPSVSLPNWNELVYNKGIDLNKVKDYFQTLNLRDAFVETKITDQDNTELTYTFFISRDRKHIGVVHLVIKPDKDSKISVTDLMGQKFDYKKLIPIKDNRFTGIDPKTGDSNLTFQVKGTNTYVSYSSVLLNLNKTDTNSEYKKETEVKNNELSTTISFNASANSTYHFVKYTAFAKGKTSEEAFNKAKIELDKIRNLNWKENLLKNHQKMWRELWKTNIEITGDNELQKMIDASNFYLLNSLRSDESWSIAPGGLSCEGYNDHIFWDCETWMFPSILLMHPKIAENCINYRIKTSGPDGAMKNAADPRKPLDPPVKPPLYENGVIPCKGMRFAWESASTGYDATPIFPWCTTGIYEIHITADVALAFWQYYLATKDFNWLRDKGWPVFKGTADFWASRVSLQDNRYCIDHVQSPDEFHFDVNNSIYINYAAKKNLEIAAKVAEILGINTSDIKKWQEIADKMMISELKGKTPDGREIYFEYEGYNKHIENISVFNKYPGPYPIIKQADVVMLSYPWDMPKDLLPDNVAANNLEFYAAKVQDGPAMTDAINSIVAANLLGGDAAYKYMIDSVKPFIRDPYYQFNENKVPKQGAFTFLTGAGGFLQTFLYGFTGFRWDYKDSIDHDVMYFDPVLPGKIENIKLHHIKWRKRDLTISITSDKTTVTLNDGEAMSIVDKNKNTYKLDMKNSSINIINRSRN